MCLSLFLGYRGPRELRLNTHQIQERRPYLDRTTAMSAAAKRRRPDALSPQSESYAAVSPHSLANSNSPKQQLPLWTSLVAYECKTAAFRG